MMHRYHQVIVIAFAFIAIATTSPVTKKEEPLAPVEEMKPGIVAPAPEPPAMVTLATEPEPTPAAFPPELPAPALAVPELPAAIQQQPPRRLITYDQRQEGKYNIRADLDNFMIVVIPSSPASGASLLDLLTRSNQQKKSHGKYSHHKKYHAPPSKVDEELRDEHQKLDYLQLQAAAVAAEQARHSQQFIEGRTPYRVDISSAGEFLQPKSRVEPLRRSGLYGRSNSPVYRFLRHMPAGDEEPAVPSVVPVQGNQRNVHDENPAVVVVSNDDDGGDGSDRNRKSLIDSNTPSEVNHNSVVILTPIEDDYIESNRGFVDLTDTSNSFDSLNVGNIDRLAVAADATKSGDGWELTLLGAQEQCGPDRKRDSYGVCQFVPEN